MTQKQVIMRDKIVAKEQEEVEESQVSLEIV